MNIIFIQTGGTIDKDYPKVVKSYDFEIRDSSVPRMLMKVFPNFKYKIVSVCKKDSMDITVSDRKRILKAIQRAPSKHIVVTHGTDTMPITARYLGPHVTDKTVVLSGAMKPEVMGNSDALFSLGGAIIAAQTLPYGVYVVMNGRVHLWNKVRKNQKTGQFVSD